MDTSKNFTKSFNGLNKNRIIAVPKMISFLLLIILVFAFASITGYYSAAKDISILKEQYDNEQIDMITQNPQMREILDFMGETGRYDKKFVAYATEQGFDWSRMTRIFETSSGQGLIALFLIIYLILSTYFVCGTFGLITLSIKKKHLFFSDIFSEANRFFLRFAYFYCPYFRNYYVGFVLNIINCLSCMDIIKTFVHHTGIFC